MERVGWFRPADYEILKYFYRYDEITDGRFESTPQLVARDLDLERDYVSGEMGKLSQAGVLERAAHGVYRLTDIGIGVVESGLSEDEIPDSPR